MGARGSIEEKAESLSGYDTIDQLRQRQDYDGLLDWAPPETTTMVDLGCGTGSLIEAAFRQFPEMRLAVGLDRLAGRLREASDKLAAYHDRIRLVEADLTHPPRLDSAFDLITMTAVLHWLYPHEDSVFSWIAEHLEPRGTFLLTTYHPHPDTEGLGGTDSVVAEALQLIGIEVEEVPKRFASAGLVPIAERTRSFDAVRDALQRHMDVEATDELPAVMRVHNGDEYQRYHAATFGTYYSRMATPVAQQEFFSALGVVAERRMDTLGHVTSMPVRRWRCRGKA